MNEKERHERVTALFLQARKLSPENREELILREENDLSLVKEVLELLEEHEREGPLRSDARAVPQSTRSRFGFAAFSEGDIFEGFQLIKLLGDGGMGQVWRAHNLSTGGSVALKLLSPSHVDREVRAAGRLRHPGIVQVHQTGRTEDLAWISMEFVEGGRTLRDQIRESREKILLPGTYETGVARTIAKVAEALQAAHDAGVVHRDVKPSNILLTLTDEPKVADFGIARTVDGERTQTGESWRTPSYCSPEQAAGNQGGVDHRTDVFSLGAVLYELLTLRKPFEGNTVQLIERKVLHEDPPDPRTIRANVPDDLAIICGKCLEKDQDRRFSSMADLAQDLRRFLANEPIRAKPPGRARRIRLWVHRNPTLSVAGSIGLLALMLVSVLAFMLAAQLRVTREAQALEHTERAEVEHSRSNWSESLALIEVARSTGGGDEVRLDLLASRNYLALQEPSAAKSILTRLEHRADQGSRRGSVSLLLGWIDLGEWLAAGRPQEQTDPLDRIRRALQQDPPGADRAVAEAILASHTADAILAYERALLLEPVNYIANISLLQLLTSAGRFEEADVIAGRCREFYPGDLATDAMQYLRDVAVGRPSEARQIRRLQEGGAFWPILEALGEFFRCVHEQRGRDYGDPNLAATAGAQWLLEAYDATAGSIYEAISRARSGSEPLSIGSLAAAVHHLGPVFDLLMETSRVFQAADGGTDFSVALGLMSQVLERHDEGWLRMIHGWCMWMEEGDVIRAIERQEEAAEMPSVIANHNLYAMEMIVNVSNLRGGPSEEVRRRQFRAGRLAAMSLLGRPDVPLPTMRSVANQIRKFSDDRLLKRMALTAWSEAEPDSRQVKIYVIRSHLALREWHAAIEVCNELLSQNGDDEGVWKLRAQAAQAATQWRDQVPPLLEQEQAVSRRIELGAIKDLMTQRQWAAAVDACEEVLARIPEDDEVFELMMRALDEAQAWLSEALKN